MGTLQVKDKNNVEEEEEEDDISKKLANLKGM